MRLDTADPAATLDFKVLGALEVATPRGLVRLGGQRQRKLLALLLLNANADVTFHRIVDTLWDEPPQSERQQVHNSVAQLRTALRLDTDEVAVVTAFDGYRLVIPPSWIDLVRFQASVREAESLQSRGHVAQAVHALRKGLALWRGDALAGLDGSFLRASAAALEEQRLAAIEHLMTARLQLGEASAIVGELTELVAHHPFREPLRAGLIAALYQAGRQAEALSVFDEGKRLLADELGLDPGPELQSLQQQVLRGEALAQPWSPFGSDSTGALDQDHGYRNPEPHYLPRDSGEFTGRDAEVAKVIATVRENSTTALLISAINGMGGVGKTALAVHMAHKLAEDYPDGQYFVDLQGFTADASPLAASDALRILLRDSGSPPERLPAGTVERSALWRAQLASRRVILLLDNAHDAAQVRPLLPGTPEALVLITSRRRLAAVEGAVPLPLDVLPLPDAVALFSRIAGTDRCAAAPGAVAQVVELCGRLPLAIRIAAARFRDRESWTVAYLAERLSDQSRRMRFLKAGDRDVMAVIKVSYRYLTSAQRRTFRLLCLHTGSDFDAKAIAALVGIPLDEAEENLESLYDDNMLLQNERGRYLLHDLVRDCSHRILEESETADNRLAATHRLLDYYLDTAYRLCLPLAQGPFRFTPEHRPVESRTNEPVDREEAIVALNKEYRNLLAAVSLAQRIDSHNHTWQIVCVLQPYLHYLCYTGDARKLFEQALDAAQKIGHPVGVQKCLTGLALVLQERGFDAEARSLLREALESNNEQHDLADVQYLLRLLGLAQLRGNFLEEAWSSFLEAQRIAKRLGDTGAYMALTNNLGVVARDLDRFGESLQYFDEALNLCRAGDPSGVEALIINNIAHVRFLRGEIDAAVENYLDALAASRRDKSSLGEGWSLVGLAASRRAMGMYTIALDHGREALELARTAGLREMECEALNSIGDVLLCLGRLEAAEGAYTKAEALSRDYNINNGLAHAYEGIAHLHMVRNDIPAAHEAWSQAAPFFTPAEAANARHHVSAAVPSHASCWRCRSFVSDPGAPR